MCRAESDVDEDHYFGDEEGDTTDSLPEDEVDEAIKRSLLEEEALPPIPSLTMSASLARQLANHSDTHSNGSLVSPALSSAIPVPLQVPPSAAPSPMDVLNPSPPPIPQPTTTSRSPSIVSESATISSAGHPSRPRPPVPPSTAAILASLKKTPTAKPTMGCFIPAETTPAHFQSVIIDGVEDRKGGAPPPTPFTRRKAEKTSSRSRGRSQSNLKTGSTGRRRDIFNKVRPGRVQLTRMLRLTLSWLVSRLSTPLSQRPSELGTALPQAPATRPAVCLCAKRRLPPPTLNPSRWRTFSILPSSTTGYLRPHPIRRCTRPAPTANATWPTSRAET